MPLKLSSACVFVAVAAAFESRALQPDAMVKDSSRPTVADGTSGEYERLTQAPMVWLNLRKTKLSILSVDTVAHTDFMKEHTAASKGHA